MSDCVYYIQSICKGGGGVKCNFGNKLYLRQLLFVDLNSLAVYFDNSASFRLTCT